MRFHRRMDGGLSGFWLSCGRCLVCYALILGMALIVSMPAAAQRITGTLRGQILDPSGAAVPDAQVTATNQETGVTVKVATTSAGTYSFPSLIPGLYKVEIEAKGFKNFLKTDVSVIANQDNEADAHLDLGIATEVVEVSGGAADVQTTSSSLNNTYDVRDVELPNAAGTLNNSPLNLAVLSPNVVAMPGGTTGIGGSVGGTRPRDNNFTVDGVDDNNLGAPITGMARGSGIIKIVIITHWIILRRVPSTSKNRYRDSPHSTTIALGAPWVDPSSKINCLFSGPMNTPIFMVKVLLRHLLDPRPPDWRCSRPTPRIAP